MTLGDAEWLDNEIHREHGLISQRIGWYVASQAFLTTAFVIGSGSGGFLKDNQATWIIPSLSIFISIIAWISILAALTSIKVLRAKQKKKCSKKFKSFWFEGRPYVHTLGSLPSWIIPPAFIIFWAVILFYVVKSTL